MLCILALTSSMISHDSLLGSPYRSPGSKSSNPKISSIYAPALSFLNFASLVHMLSLQRKDSDLFLKIPQTTLSTYLPQLRDHFPTMVDELKAWPCHSFRPLGTFIVNFLKMENPKIMIHFLDNLLSQLGYTVQYVNPNCTYSTYTYRVWQ